MKMLIRGKAVYDGTGAPPRTMDILIEDGVIADLGPHLAGDFSTVIEGNTVCPGFIDIHRHCDNAVFTSADFGKTELLQGITTTVAGNCGLAPVPGIHQWQAEHHRYLEPVTGFVPQDDFPLRNFHQYRESLEKRPLPINLGFLAGSGSIKTVVKGFSNTPFTAGEMASAQAHIREAFDAGALGLSMGLLYMPECFSNVRELAALARAAAGRILCIHIRSEGDGLVESVDEAICLAESAGLPVNISHFKAMGIKNWNSLIYRAIEKIEAARGQGLEITADFYPYEGGSTTILSLIPPTVQGDSVPAMCAALREEAGKDMLRRELQKQHPGWDNVVMLLGWERIMISSVTLPEHSAYCGRNMADIAREEGFRDPEELLAELTAQEQGSAGIISFSMDRSDIDTIARLPWTCLISDSLYGPAANPHPRLNGAFPKFLREYARERKVLSMEAAIHKMTAMPARRMGLKNRGVIQKGNAADLLVFDPAEFRDNAGFFNSTALASGMDIVILNGRIAYNAGIFYEPNGRVVERL